MALYTALRRPEMFGAVLAQSSSLSFGAHDFVLWDLLRAPQLPRMWLVPGRYELPGLLADNRRLRDLLVARGAEHEYREMRAVTTIRRGATRCGAGSSGSRRSEPNQSVAMRRTLLGLPARSLP